jgi:hypothetical protein
MAAALDARLSLAAPVQPHDAAAVAAQMSSGGGVNMEGETGAGGRAGQSVADAPAEGSAHKKRRTE